MKAIVKEPFSREARVIEIDGDLKSLQSIVGGYIETLWRFDTLDGGVVAYCNEEGKLKELPLNFVCIVWPHVGDHILGSVIAVGNTHDGESRSLTDKEAADVITLLEAQPQ